MLVVLIDGGGGDLYFGYGVDAGAVHDLYMMLWK